jgi:hypothetical protein
VSARGLGWWLNLTAVLFSVAMSVVLLVAPTYSNGRTILEANSEPDAWFLFVFSVPVALSALPLAFSPGVRAAVALACGCLLTVLSFVAAASTGLVYAPAALLLLASSWVRDRGSEPGRTR